MVLILHNNRHPDVLPRRQLLKLVVLGGVPVTAIAQAPPTGMANVAPLPTAWQSLGMTQWPVLSGQLTLIVDEIVLRGSEVRVQMRSSLRFTQTLALYSRKHSTPNDYEQLALQPATQGLTTAAQAKLTVTAGQALIFLAKTPYGWFRTERDIHVGRLPGGAAKSFRS